jgi:hypothetical protein
MKWIFGLVGLAALLFIVGGVGTIASFISHADGARVVFMYVFLAGLVPTMIFLVVSLGIGAYHLYLNRVAGRTPSGWFASDKKGAESGEE